MEASANQRIAGLPASLPATKPWTVASTNRTKLVACTRRHSQRGSLRWAREVSSMASSIYRATTPQATATGRQVDRKGTSRSATPKSV
jgi:hypothetical protein